jgi:hypothetical protein
LTYCVAWKTETSAFIFADSAITEFSNNESEQPITTSFLEKQGKLNSGKSVFEGAFKIFSEDSYAIGMSGDSRFATQVVELLQMHLSVGRSVCQSIDMTINNFTDFSTQPYIELVVAAFDEVPILFTIKNRGDEYKVEQEDLVLLGSPTEDLISYTRNFYQSFKKTWNEERYLIDRDERLFARMFGLLQSYGIHSYTIEEGIGGTYSGVMINSTGLITQPDTCFLISGESTAFDTRKTASIYVEQNCLCIINSDMAEIVIPNKVASLDKDTALSIADNARETFDSGRFKYVILLNLSMHSVCIVDMNYGLNHLFLNIDIREDKKGTIGFVISETLEKYLNNGYDTRDDTAIYYFPFEPASVDQLSFIKENINRLRVGSIVKPFNEEYKFLIYQSEKLIDWFYGNKESIFSFFKEHQNYEYLMVVDLSTDYVSAEFKNGEIIFPKLEFPISEVFENISNKVKKEDIFLFDAYLPNIDEPYEINILADNLDFATQQANAKLASEYGESFGIVFSGKRFYHPEYYWKEET